MVINLTKSQCKIVADFIEENFFDVIRNDTDIDSFDWMIELVDIYKKLRECEHT